MCRGLTISGADRLWPVNGAAIFRFAAVPSLRFGMTGRAGRLCGRERAFKKRRVHI